MDNQIENPPTPELVGDVDENGHLALAVFAVVVVILLLVIYALA